MRDIAMRILKAAFWLCILGAAIFAILYVLGLLGIELPPRVVQLLVAAGVILAVIWIVAALTGADSWRPWALLLPAVWSGRIILEIPLL